MKPRPTESVSDTEDEKNASSSSVAEFLTNEDIASSETISDENPSSVLLPEVPSDEEGASNMLQEKQQPHDHDVPKKSKQIISVTPGAARVTASRATWKEQKESNRQSNNSDANSNNPVDNANMEEEGTPIAISIGGSVDTEQNTTTLPGVMTFLAKPADWKERKGLRRTHHDSSMIDSTPALNGFANCEDADVTVARDEPPLESTDPVRGSPYPRGVESSEPGADTLMEQGELQGSSSLKFVHATLVEESDHVIATAAPEGNFILTDDLDQIVEEKVATKRRTWCIYVGLLLAIVVVVVTVVGVVLGTRETSSSDVVAQCKPGVVEIPVESSDCILDSIDPTVVDNGSIDPKGGNLQWSLSPLGPYAVGMHFLSMTVTDNLGNSDTCSASVMVSGNKSEWFTLQHHAYRLEHCKVSWSKAQELADFTTQCGLQAHLATITSRQEQAFVKELGYGEVWLGGNQSEAAKEPDGGWMWVNGEGMVNEGYTDWDEGEPDKEEQDCLAMLDSDRGYHWGDRNCISEYTFLEEIDYQGTVMVDGCDSGVSERFDDVETCTPLIQPGLDECGSHKTNNNFQSCIDRFLARLVNTGKMLQLEKEQILFCGSGNQNPVAACRDVPKVVPESQCSNKFPVDASMFDNNSTDPDGDSLTFEIFPAGPFPIGKHEVTLTVYDGHGGLDHCQATLLLKGDEALSSPWVKLGKNAYRVRLCPTDWHSANTFSSMSSFCGQRAHLASITSPEENSMLVSAFGNGHHQHWLGGFQPHGSNEPSGNWSWIGDEGLIYDGYTNWEADKPNNKGNAEHCLLLTDKEKWDDEWCSERMAYIEEVDLADVTVCDGLSDGITSQSATQWVAYNNHAYRIRFSATNWTNADALAKETNHCGVNGHLATLPSEREQLFAKGLLVGELWLGGFQPPGSLGPDKNWTWVNGEGSIDDGYTDWRDGEPNNGQFSEDSGVEDVEDCLLLLRPERDYQWDDRSCSSEYYWFLEEVDLEAPSVIVDSCDSGVPDVLVDAESCRYGISSKILDCSENRSDKNSNFTACLDMYLMDLVEEGMISSIQRKSILFCQHQGNNATVPTTANAATNVTFITSVSEVGDENSTTNPNFEMSSFQVVEPIANATQDSP